METIGLLGGSFNPVHIGHVMLASYLSQYTELDRVWLTLSPQNPLRKDALADDRHRLAMLRLALEGNRHVDVCDIELTMPRPSYSIATLDLLSELYPDKHFRFIIGSDNWLIFQKWKDWQRIIDDYGLVIYPRPGYQIEEISHPNVVFVNAPIIELSSTFIRQGIADGKDMNNFMPPRVFDYIQTHQLYRK